MNGEGSRNGSKSVPEIGAGNEAGFGARKAMGNL